MYSLTATQQANFLSTDFMAVATNSTVSAAAVDGAINIVKIKSAGTGGTNGTFTVYNKR
jgi:7-keto-8-aminopelargonate synthetase-like enzyme